MNQFKKYCPNVWIAECEEKYKKGVIIELTTKYDKTVECEVYNLIAEKNNKFYYSIVRLDEPYAQRKAEKYTNSIKTAIAKSNDYYGASQEGREFLALGEPIKVGHHSEKRHRALIERNRNRMDKSMELISKAKELEQKAAYWENKSNEITLAMPESIKYFNEKLEKAIVRYEGLKNGTIEREHSYSLTYANNDVKELKNKVITANILWGDN